LSVFGFKSLAIAARGGTGGRTRTAQAYIGLGCVYCVAGAAE